MTDGQAVVIEDPTHGGRSAETTLISMLSPGIVKCPADMPFFSPCIKSLHPQTISVKTALAGPVGWLLIFLSISVLTVTFERLRFWFLWWKRRSLIRNQWLDCLGRGGATPLCWMEERDLEMRFAQPFLEAVSVIAPLTGLIGTVLGLSHLLSAMGPDLILPPGRHLGGFGEVLVSTALGLCISLLATVMFHLNNGLRQWQRSRWQRDLNCQPAGPAARS
jgi:biopolymer transport protein ExbB